MSVIREFNFWKDGTKYENCPRGKRKGKFSYVRKKARKYGIGESHVSHLIIAKGDIYNCLWNGIRTEDISKLEQWSFWVARVAELIICENRTGWMESRCSKSRCTTRKWPSTFRATWRTGICSVGFRAVVLNRQRALEFWWFSTIFLFLFLIYAKEDISQMWLTLCQKISFLIKSKYKILILSSIFVLLIKALSYTISLLFTCGFKYYRLTRKRTQVPIGGLWVR